MLRSISTEPFYMSHYADTAGTDKFVGESNGFKSGFYPSNIPQTTTNFRDTLNTIDHNE